ncbi:hypothetical protein, partial [Streptomyces sp. SID3343]|uniref:hypothetical protein n=1 Tax=Streptomyces sp. SID3343 TaxID=2690260 RepID=UPI001370281A|nr:hypothetical protein [Streptomyces sp. SID3343]
MDAAGTTEFGYDRAGRTSNVVDPQTNSTISYDYDSAGRPTGETYRPTTTGEATARSAPSADRRYSYDPFGRLAYDAIYNAQGAAQQQTSYTYDADNRLTGRNDSTTGGRNNTYAYDLAGRLTEWNDGTTVTPYTWDPAGNRTSAADKTATYDERNRLLT